MIKLNSEDQISPTKINISSLLTSWNISTFDMVFPNEGIENINIIVREPTQRSVLKVYRQNGNTLKQITAEIDFVNYLSSKGIPVAKYKLSVDNKFIVIKKIENKEWICVLMDYIEGHHPNDYSIQNVHEIGKVMAKFHLLSIQYSLNEKSDGPGTIKENLINNLDKKITKADFISFIERIKDFKIKPIKDLPMALIHTDIHKHNLLFKGNTLAAIIDFDDMYYSYLVQDLGVMVANLLRTSYLKKGDITLVNEFLNAYQSIRPITSNEKEQLKIFTLFRHYIISSLDLIMEGEMGQSTQENIYLEKKILEIDFYEFFV